ASSLMDRSARERTFIAWNVNGARAWVNKGGHTLFNIHKADLVFLGETKCEQDEIPPELKSALEEYQSFTLVPSSKRRKGQAGVALFSKEKPLEIWKGTGVEEFDDAGRLIIAEYATFYFVGAYVPNSGTKNLEKRGRWEATIRNKLIELDGKKPVIYGGDLNVAHQEIDLAIPMAQARMAAGCTDQERYDMTRLLESGVFVDTFRLMHPDRAEFTSSIWMGGGGLVDARLDYFLASNRLGEKIRESGMVKEDNKTSDHCPIKLKIDI
ncbi:hypothetical protein PENTCL1PPCAC_8662, partial [Pristionchus entomophagus]